MRLSRFFAVPLSLSIASSIVTLIVTPTVTVARADDAKTYALDVKPLYKVGETLTSTAHESNTHDTKVATAEGVIAFAQNETDVLDFTSTRKVLAVDAEGKIAKEVIHFSAWKHTKGETESSDLTGAHVEVTGRGATRAWKLLTPELTLADTTKAWLDKKHGADDKSAFEDALKPSKPVAVGESWDLDVTKVAAAMGKEMELDTAKSSAKATLTGVDAELASIHLEMKLQVKAIATGTGATLKVIEGGMLEMTGEGHAPLARSARDDGGKMTIKMETKTDAPQNMTATISIEGSQESSTKAGGEMPEVAAAKAEMPPK